jgi:hypothetical protein
VAAGGEFHAELSGDDARAAVGGIAGDADAHISFQRSIFSGWFLVFTNPNCLCRS